MVKDENGGGFALANNFLIKNPSLGDTSVQSWGVQDYVLGWTLLWFKDVRVTSLEMPNSTSIL